MPTKPAESLYIPSPRLNQLHIMQQIAKDPHVTQASLARQCSLSVAMVNNYMKELCSTGLLEYQRKSSKTVSYHLTLAGQQAVADTTHSLFQELVRQFANAKEKVRDCLISNGCGELRRVVLFGSGDLAELVFHALDAVNVNIVGVCDDDPARIGRDWCGREVLNSSQIRFIAPDAIILAADNRFDELYSNLSCLQDRGIRVICLNGNFASTPPQRHEASSPRIGDLSLASNEESR